MLQRVKENFVLSVFWADLGFPWLLSKPALASNLGQPLSLHFGEAFCGLNLSSQTSEGYSRRVLLLWHIY